MGKETKHTFKSNTGSSAVRQTRSGDIIIDSYFGDVRDKNNHDRFSLNVTTGEVFGHDKNHKNTFDTAKENYGKKKEKDKK